MEYVSNKLATHYFSICGHRVGANEAVDNCTFARPACQQSDRQNNPRLWLQASSGCDSVIEMRTRMQQLPTPTVMGGLAALGGAVLWQLGIEFERAWMRSYDGPLPGDEALPHDAFIGSRAEARQHAQIDPATRHTGKQRRWVAKHHPRAVRPSGARRLA